MMQPLEVLKTTGNTIWRWMHMTVTRTLGAFSHSVPTAPIPTLFIPGTPLKTTHLQKQACMHSKQHQGCRIQDPGARGYRW